MKQTQETLPRQNTTERSRLYMAFELGNSKWKLAFSDGNKVRYVTILARDLRGVHREIDRAKERFGLGEGVEIFSCYEAGRDGFWLHRYLVSIGVKNLVVDSSSIEVNRRKRRAKTDRIDAGKLLSMLMRYHGGERRAWSVVRVPNVQEEDARNLHRELEVLKRERVKHCNRIQGFLIQHGIAIKNPRRRDFLCYLDSRRTWDGRPLPPDLKARLVREYQRLEMVQEQIRSLEKERAQRVLQADSVCLQKVAQLMMLRGIGPNSSWVFVMEFFGWRDFRNRRQIGALSGLTPTPYDSGAARREQGISKAGNRRIRALSVEIAWAWLRFQPQSKLSRWFTERFALGGSRMRRIGIVAMARRLLIDLWHYLEDGVIPEGACLKSIP